MTDDDATERTIIALIDAELPDPASLPLHIDAVRRTIDGSGLPLGSRLELLARLARLASRVDGAARQIN